MCPRGSAAEKADFGILKDKEKGQEQVRGRVPALLPGTTSGLIDFFLTTQGRGPCRLIAVIL